MERDPRNAGRDTGVLHAVPEIVKVSLFVMLWCGLGLFIMCAGFWVTDVQTGQILLSLGMLAGYTGMTVTLARAYLRAEERGDL